MGKSSRPAFCRSSAGGSRTIRSSTSIRTIRRSKRSRIPIIITGAAENARSATAAAGAGRAPTRLRATSSPRSPTAILTFERLCGIIKTGGRDKLLRKQTFIPTSGPIIYANSQTDGGLLTLFLNKFLQKSPDRLTVIWKQAKPLRQPRELPTDPRFPRQTIPSGATFPPCFFSLRLALR